MTATTSPPSALIAAAEPLKLRPVSVEVDGEARTFLLNEHGKALALDQDLGMWLGLNRHAYPLRRNIRWYAEQGTLGEVSTVYVMSGRPGRPVSAYCLSRDQLLLLLTVAVIAVRPQARERTLRGYHLAEGKPAAQELRPELPAAPSVLPGRTSEGLRDAPGPSVNDDPSPSVELVPFVGGTISALRAEGMGWFVLKPACEALGVDARGQQQRLERTPWATACVMHAVGADGKRREMFCLRADRVAMWLATIDTPRIADPEARQRLELWQCHAAEALDRWARGRDAVASEPAPDWRHVVDHTLDRARELFVEKTAPTPAPHRAMDPAQWLSPREAAQRAGVGVRRVYGWLRSAQLEHRRLGPRDLRIHVDALSAFLAAHDRAASPSDPQ